MKASSTNTFDPAYLSDDAARRFRNQATGVSPCLGQSEAQGANRSRRVIDAAPVTQLKVADRSYPAPGPAIDPLTGQAIDRMTGKKWKPEMTPASGWTR